MNAQVDNKEILEKVKKLLSLATSSNEHEANVATNKAQELLTRYNLTMQSISQLSEYEKVELADEPYIKPHQNYISSILIKYFFVEIVYTSKYAGGTVDGRTKYRKHIMLAGTATNVVVAEYIFAFLSTSYLSLWLQYKRANNASETQRKSYYAGLTKGLANKLDATRVKVESEMGLVIVKDQNILKECFGKTKSKSNKVRLDESSYEAGQQDGKNINIAKPLSGNSSNSGKYLK